MKNSTVGICVAAALALGGAAGYFLAPRESVAQSAADTPQKAAKPLADQGESASVRSLRARVAELERQLADQPVREVAVTNAPPAARGWGSGSFQENLARIEKEDPARYAQMTNRMAQFRARMLERAQSKIDFLSSVDLSRFSPAARQVHADLQDAIARREELLESLQRRDLTDAERETVFKEMRETSNQLRELNRKERANLLNATARELGFKGEAAKEITAAVTEIIKATEDGFMGPGGHHGRGGPR